MALMEQWCLFVFPLPHICQNRSLALTICANSQGPISIQYRNCLLCQTKFVDCKASLPPQSYIMLLTQAAAPSKCFFGTGHGYALVLTQLHAVIWPYLISASSPSPADIFTLALPEPCRDPAASAPLGVLLSTATAGPPGLIVIIPSTGRIVYWETVSSATSLGLSRHRQNGLQGSISGLLSGEYVTDLVNGEPSGVIATLSSGRVVHVTVGNFQGKPTVMTNFLRSSTGAGSTGFLGGIKSVLGGGSWRKEVAAARPGESHQRGQRDIIIATTNGLVEVWDTHWNNGSMLKEQFDLKQHLSHSLGPEIMDSGGDNGLKIHDFAFAAGDHNDTRESQGGTELWPLYFVVELPQGSNPKRLCVVQIILSDEEPTWSIRSIDLHQVHPSMNTLKPKLYVPKPGGAGFIIMGQSVIVLSLTPFEASLTPQFLVDSDRHTRLFYDTIDFRSGIEYEILGSGFEESNYDGSLSACLVMVRGYGIIRVAVQPRRSDVDDTQVTTAKHKIEQAVFYGTMLGNPLNLASKGGLDFPAEDMEQAALEICRELLRSKSKFIPSSGISLDQNLRSRAKSLDDLAFLLTQHGLPFNGLVWWELLWGAEKLAAQRAMWKVEEESRKKNSNEPTFLSRVIGVMSEKFKTKFESVDSEGDYVRHWFLHDTYQMEHILPWIFKAIKPQKGQPKQGWKMAEQTLEASEFSLAVLETAFRVRDERASLYGLNEELLEDGVLVASYEDLPEFWTSNSMAYIETGHLLDWELGSCMAWIQSSVDAPKSHVVEDIAKNCARQLRVLSQMHNERIRWLSAQEDPKAVDEILATEQSHVKQRRWQLFKLAGVGQLNDAINLAEKFRDMSALVELIIELQDQTKCQLFPEISENGPGFIDNESEELGKKISRYFEKFGEAWANTFFSRQISMGQSGILFAMRKFQPFVTRFLREDPAYARLSWINDVVGENDYSTAALSLERLAIEQEPDLWSHRAELSLAKLAKLAVWENTGSGSYSTQNDVKRLEDYAEIDAIQEVVHAYIAPALQGAIDRKAEIDLAIEQFGKDIAQSTPSLHEVLGSALTKVVTRQVIGLDQLVDLLTLLDNTAQNHEHTQSELSGKEFYLALRAIRLGQREKDHVYVVALQKLVWRRCMIKNNWHTIGRAAESMGDEDQSIVHDTVLFRTLLLCLKDGKFPFSPFPMIL